MARVKRAVGSKKHRKAGARAGQGLLRQQEPLGAGGQRAGHASGQYAFRDRRAKKGEFRRLWIQRINAACRLNDISYSRFIAGLNAAGIEVDRKVLADLAVTDPAAFGALVEAAKAASERPPTLPARRSSNPRVQRLRRLLGRRSARYEEGVFVVEGLGLLRQAVAAGWQVEAQFVAPEPIAVVDVARAVRARAQRDGAGRLDGVAAAGARRRVDARPSTLPVGRRRSSSSPTGSPTPATPARSSARPRPPAPTASCSRPARSIRSTRRSCGASAGSLFRVPVSSRRRSNRSSACAALGTSSHRGDVYTDPVYHGRRSRSWSATRPTARRRRRRSTSGSRIPHAGRPRASTWRWPRRSLAIRSRPASASTV